MTRIALVLLLTAGTLMAQPKCSVMRELWAFNLTLTDGNPFTARSAIFDFREYSAPAFTFAGQATGFREIPVTLAWDGGLGANCSTRVQSYSLLEQNGVPAGKRIGLYSISYGVDGKLAGRFKLMDFDTAGAQFAVSTGTVIGTAITPDAILDYYLGTFYNDPFWTQQ